MRNKENLYEWIDRYNQGNLSGTELEVFQGMMAANHRIREEVILDKELNTILKRDDILELRRKIRKIISEDPGSKNLTLRIVLLAASFLILLSLEYVIFYQVRQGNPKHKTESVRNLKLPGERAGEPQMWAGFDSAIVNIDLPWVASSILYIDSMQIRENKKLMACYQPNKMLEKLTGTTSRSGSVRMLNLGRSGLFNSTGTVWLSWKTGRETETNIVIENNKGEVVYESDPNNNQSVVLRASFLGYGLFYYKIMEKDEVIYFGKFTIQ